VGLHSSYHCLCGAVGEECSIVDLWVFSLLQTLPLRISFKVGIEYFLLELRARSREMMTMSRDFLNDHSA
jgi:hypothetical protein